jgi:hypothetical protein
MIEKGWCRSTINMQIGRVKALFKWAVAQEQISPTIYHGLQSVSGLKAERSQARESDPVRPVTDDVVEMTLVSLTRGLVGSRPGASRPR